MKLRLVCDGSRHLVCIPYSVKNLHRMAQEISLPRAWFHRDHYDMPKGRIVEITGKSIVVPSKTIVRLIRNYQHPAKKALRMTMPVQQEENFDHEAVLYKKFVAEGKTGVHYCPDWDYMALHDKSPEMSGCCCGDTIYNGEKR